VVAKGLGAKSMDVWTHPSGAILGGKPDLFRRS